MWNSVPQVGWFVDSQEPRIQYAKRSDMCIAVMKGLRFADTKEWFFETWKSSHMGCAALLCGRFTDVRELRFKQEKL